MNIVISYGAYRFTDRQDDIGGEERVAWETASGLASRGHAVTVYSPIVELRQDYPNLKAISFPNCDFKHAKGRARRIAKALRFARLSRRHIEAATQADNVDVVHHLCPAYPGFSSSVSDLRAPFVYGPATVSYDRSIERGRRESLLLKPYGLLKNRAYEKTLRNAARILLEVPSAARWMPQSVLGKTEVFSNSIPVERYRPTLTPGIPGSSSAYPVLLYHGGLRKNKGIHVLLHAMRIVADTYGLRPRLRLVGKLLDGALRDLARSLDIANQVEFLGPVAQYDVPSALNQYAIYVFPTLQDNAPKGLLEAMAMALPIITTNVLDIPTIARPNREALVVPSSDPDALARAIHTLISSVETQRRLGRSARERCVTNYSQEARCDRLVQIYREVGNSRSSYD